MEPIHIVLITAGGIFVLLMLAYLISALYKYNSDFKQRQMLDACYSDKNLAKMEYDLAFYDDETYRLMKSAKVEEQVTIDDLMSQNAEPALPNPNEALFAKIDNEGVEEIRGKFNPDKK